MNKESMGTFETARDLLETTNEDIRAQIENIVYLQELLLNVKDDNINTQYMQKGIGMFSMFTDKLSESTNVLVEVQNKLNEVAHADN
jgi:hypothetical protein